MGRDGTAGGPEAQHHKMAQPDVGAGGWATAAVGAPGPCRKSLTLGEKGLGLGGLSLS